MRPGPPERRRASPRAAVDLRIALVRGRGGPVRGHTVDLGGGGMRVATERPLSVNELLAFEIESDDGALSGRARVLREQGGTTYALQFEALPAATRSALEQIVAGGAISR